ncbi:MAG: serine/threonine protein kinase [Gemmataceae bacterium]|nr:serine/threonine protein kinase [Gemmataceae bacterium]
MQGRTVLGKYVVDRQIGRGSMGEVFLAHPVAGGPDIVVKTMAGKVAGQQKFREMFAREIAMMARFRHPHAVELIEGGVDPVAGPCIVMEYVPGPDLAKALELYRTFDAERVGRLIVPLCQALHAAHSAGIIHRDLKPANVKLLNAGTPDESVKVMDLGLAAIADKPHIPLEKLRGSQDEFAVGSPAYMSPEQIRGDGVDARADLYSLGVLMFELISGRLPFDEEDLGILLRAHLSQRAPTFASVGVEGVPPRVEAVILQCLEKYPNERPTSAFELARQFKIGLGQLDALDPEDFNPVLVGEGSSATHAIAPVGSNTQRIVQTMEAWMPEAIAVVKLRGFLEDMGANILTSEPGLIRVTLGEPPPQAKRGLFSWLSKAATPAPTLAPVAIDLYLTKKPAPANKLEVTTVFRALSGPLPDDPAWHQRTKKLHNDLRGYLMAQR